MANLAIFVETVLNLLDRHVVMGVHVVVMDGAHVDMVARPTIVVSSGQTSFTIRALI